MLQTQSPLPVNFICGFIYNKEDIYIRTKDILKKKFGRIDYESEKINFDFTNYYDSEIGKPLFRKFVSFEKLKNPGDFSKTKLFCIKIEKKFSLNLKRKINIDPGYINEAKLILTTTKDYSHRIYIGRGIYAEVTLIFKDNKFCELQSTFPDYRTQLYKGIFLSIRKLYREKIAP